MNIKSSLVALFLIFGLCTASFAEELPKLQQLSKHVWANAWTSPNTPNGNSFGANAGLVVGSKAALIIDTLTSYKEATRFLADVRKITNKPLKYIVNTHYHLDHSWGNCVFVKVGGQVVAHEQGRELFKRSEYGMAHPEEFGFSAKDLEGTTAVPPTSTFSDRMSIDLGGVEVVLRYPGPTHSPDSILVEIPGENVLFTGDLLFSSIHPFLAEGKLDIWRQQLARLEMGPDRILVPGHGPLSTKKDLHEMRVYLTRFDILAKKLCEYKRQEDAPALAKELIKLLPQQGRGEDPMMLIMNLKNRYLPKSEQK